MPLLKRTDPKLDASTPPPAIQVVTPAISATTQTVVFGATTEAPKPAYTGRKAATDDDKMSKADWAAKDRRIGRAGLYQAALQSVGVLQYSPDVRSLADYLKAVRAAAEDGLKFVNEEESK